MKQGADARERSLIWPHQLQANCRTVLARMVTSVDCNFQGSGFKQAGVGHEKDGIWLTNTWCTVERDKRMRIDGVTGANDREPPAGVMLQWAGLGSHHQLTIQHTMGMKHDWGVLPYGAQQLHLCGVRVMTLHTSMVSSILFNQAPN